MGCTSMPNFKSLALLLPLIRDSKAPIYMLVLESTHFDLVFDLSWPRRPEILLLSCSWDKTDHKSCIICQEKIISKFDLSWPDLDLRAVPWPQKSKNPLSKHHRCILYSKWPKNMCRMTVMYHVNMVTFGDLTLTWPLHATDLWVSQHLFSVQSKTIQSNWSP